jgi:hypothetical protein
MDHEIRKSRVVTLLLPTIGVSYYLFGPSGMRYGGHAVTQRRNFPFDALGMKFLFVFPRGTRFLLDYRWSLIYWQTFKRYLPIQNF